MADRIKNYEIQYNILSNATKAAEGFASLLGYVEKLSGKDPSTGMARGLTKISGEINQVVKDATRLNTAFKDIRPEIDMSGFKSQIGQMQRAVAEFAQQTRNIMRMAMSGTDKQFAKARGAMSGNIFDAASLRWFEDELKKMPQKINDATRAITDAKNKYNAAINSQRSYPLGATAQEIKDIDAAADREQKALLANLNNRQRALENLQKQQENYTRQAQNLRSTLSEEAMRPVPGPATVTIPKGITKATDLIPKWKQEHENARALALAKRAELANSIRQPERVEKPSWYDGIRSKYGVQRIDNYMRQYIEASKKYAETNSVAQQRIMNDAKMHFMGLGSFNEAQFNEAYKQFQAYEKYKADYRQWVTAGKPQSQEYNQTDEYKNYRASLKRLRAAYAAQRQGEALRARMAATATTPAGSAAGGPLPPILGIQPQIIEQAFTGKLTLLPDLPAARSLIAAETFNANLNLVPLIAELRAKLNSEKFSVNVTPQLSKARGAAKGKGATGAIGTLQEELNQLKSSAKVPIAIGTQLDRTGLLGRAQSGYNVLQELAKRHPITYKLASDGSGGFSLNQALARLTELAKSRPVPFRMVHDGSGGLALNQALARLQSLANTRPIQLKTALSGNGTINVNSIKPTGSVNVPLRGVLYKKNITPPSTPIQVKVAAKIAGGNNKNFGLNINTLGLESKVAQLERLRTVWASLPRTGSRTYTVNLKTTGLENIARLEQLLRLVNKMPPSDRRSYNIAARVSETGGRTTTIGAIGGSRRTPVYTKSADDFYTRTRKWAYPFTGNTSFGARTPAAFDMMKGMGVMMGIGGAMGVVGSSFSDAVNYQNVMETAKAILRDNYKGTNFNADYDDMVRIVRDVAMRTKFTAPEAADAARFMAMAGLDIPAIKGAISPIADVAAISDMDLGIVADKMTNIMTTYQRSPEQMRNLADMMTKTFTSTNTDMMMLAESLQYAGPMAFASGQSLAETLAMIGIMGNSGIQASMAGTTMRMMLQNIYKPNKNQAKFMESIGLKTRDANGNRRPLFDILSDITTITGKSDAKNVVGNLLAGKDVKANIDTFDAASNLFRVTAAAGGASLLGNIGGLAELIAKIQGASGNSAAVSLAKQNTVAGMWAQAKSAFTEAVVKVFEDTGMQKYIKGTLKDLIDYLKQPEFIQTIKDLFELIKGIGKVLGTFVGWWIKLYQTFPNLTKWVMIGQMFFTQVGYLLTPFTQLTGLLAKFGNAINGTAAALGVVNGAAGMSVANTVAGGSFAAAAAARAAFMKRNPSMATTVLENGAVSKRFATQYAESARVYESRFNALDAALTASLLTNGRKDPRTQKLANLTQEAYQRRELYRNAVTRSKEIQNRYNRIYGTGHRALRAFNAGFNGITGAALFTSMFSTIKTALSGFVVKLSGIAGFLLSPMTLAAGALGGLAIAAGVAAYNFYKTNAAWQEGIKNSGVQFRDELQKAWGQNTSLKDVFEHIKTINVNSASINVNEGEIAKAVSKIAEDENLKSIYEVLNSKIREDIDGTLGIADTKLSGVSKGTFKEAYNQYISPMRSVMGNLPSFEQFLSYIEKGDIMSSIDETKAAAAITQAIIGQKGTQSGRYDQAEQKVLDLTKSFNVLSVSEQLAQWDAYRSEIMGIAEAFNPKNHPNLVPITSGNFQQALTGSPAQYYEYWLGGYNSILRFIDESPALKAIQAIHTLNSGVEEKTEEWWNAIIDIIGATSFNDEHYNGIRDFTIPTRNGQIDYSRLTQKINATGERLNDNIGTYLQWVSQIYDIIFSNDGIAQQLNGVNFPTKEEIIRHLFGSESLPKWMRESFTTPSGFGWGGWTLGGNSIGGSMDQRISGFLGTIKNGSTPNTPSPGLDYEWNPYINQWVKKAGAKTSSAATTTTPSPTGSTSKTTTPKPTAYTPSSLNSGYESSYAQNAARPTQVVINIDKLMNTDKMLIASDAEERQLAGAMEDKIEQALDILKSQIVMSLQRGDYSMS